MLDEAKKNAASTNGRRAKTDEACAAEPEMAEVLFYGASRFEQPELGLVFLRDNQLYRLISISKSERNYLRRFSQVWEFTALCERLPSPIH